MLRNVSNSAGIVDDILCHGNEETTHDAAVITLLEAARANNSCRLPDVQRRDQCREWSIVQRA